jgi:hypothetical protein
MVARARASGLPFPYLKDEDGTLARELGALVTPHAFVFDADRRLRYRGRIDDARHGSWPGPGPRARRDVASTHWLKSALAFGLRPIPSAPCP